MLTQSFEAGTIWDVIWLYETYNMRLELQSQNRVNGDCEKTTGPIYLKFWHKFLLMSTTEIQK